MCGVKEEVPISLSLYSLGNKRGNSFLAVREFNYKHICSRMMFVDYGTVFYPVTIVMNEELAREYNEGKKQEGFIVDSMKELYYMLNVVINSETMVTLIQNLINEALRQELKKIQS